MKRAAAVVLVALVLVGAWAVRRSPGEPLDAESAYRLRLAELTLAAGSAPETDRFLAHPAGAPVPFPVLLHGALAALARAFPPEPGAVGARSTRSGERLIGLARRGLPWLGALAAALGFVAVRRLPGAGPWAAGAAAALWAGLPQIVAAERVARVDPHALVAALLLAQLALLPGALRGRELSDVTLAAVAAGLLGGLALLADPAALVFEVCFAGALARAALARGGDARRDAWRATLLFSLTAAVVTILPPTEHGPRMAGLLPPLGGSSMVAGWTDAWFAWGVFPLAWLVSLRGAREPERAFLAVLGPVALVAATLDGRFEVVFAVALVPTVAVAFGALAARGPLRAVLGMLLILPALVPWVLDRPHPAGDVALARGLRWMRDHTPPSGPYNHPDARQDWCVLTAPSFAGLVVFHARRPVAAASFDGTVSERGRRVARALLSPTPEDLADAMLELDARYVAVSPAMLGDAAVRREGPGSEGALQRLALPPENAPPDHYPGLELVYSSNLWIAPGGPAISIYRLRR